MIILQSIPLILFFYLLCRFGEITNVLVDTKRRTATIKFTKIESAIRAKKSQEPILANPLIKLCN
jgi:hypothetical protein